MEASPALDLDSALTYPNTPASSALPFPPSASSSSMQNGHADGRSPAGVGGSQTPSAHQKCSSGPHIRSRITVVCAECKRLKLKCDRRTPCSSCLKRDTVQRCVYSQAAAEKVDVQTLHNRLTELERTIDHLLSTSPSPSVCAALGGLSSIRQSSAATGPNRAGPSSSHPSLMAGLPCNDRALLAQGSSGSSVVISLDDVASLWLSELEDEGGDPKVRRTSALESHSGPMRPSASSAGVKLEPTAASIPPPSSPLGSSINPLVGGLRTLHPPVPYDVFLPPPSDGPSAIPQVTAQLVSHLPAEPERSRYLKAFRETMLLHPCFNVPNFEQRIAAVFAWAEGGSVPASTAPMSKAELAKDIFFSSAKDGSSSKKDQPRGSGPPPGGVDKNAPKPTLSFFAAACAAFALGALVARDEEEERPAPPAGAPQAQQPARPPVDTVGASATLFALSEQTMGLFEKTAAFDLDSVMAMILQVLYMLHEGQMSVAQNVFPLVGKMVNVARMMGLAIDPDEFPGAYNLFEAETRRRLWWDVCYYDLFVADCMGHPPLIADNTHTTRLPTDVDEDKFTPSSTSLPTPDNMDGDTSSAYFGLKCRLAQLVKNVKKQTFRDPLSEEANELSIDSASTFEGDIMGFLQEIPPGFRLEMAEDMSKPLPPPSGSPIRLAQKCELAILSYRLVMKLYLPFLKEAALTNRPAHQAVFGTITAAHNIIHASRLLHSVWAKTRPAVFDFYDFGRTLFDAAVVCAHAVIQEPKSIIATEGMKSVACAVDVLKELDSSRMGVEGARAEQSAAGSRNEAVRIVEVMKRKAEIARSGGAASAGTKRKHAEVEPEPLVASSGFQLPFVGASVSSAKADRPRAPASSAPRSVPAPAKDAGANGEGKTKADGKKKEKEKGKEKNGSKAYDGPLRVRPMTGQPNPRRQRTASVSTAAGATPTPAPPPPPPPRTAPPPPSPLTSTIQTSLPPTSSSHAQSAPTRASVSVSESPSVSTPYESYPPPAPAAAPGTQDPVPQPEDYGMQFSGSDDVVEDRRYSAHSSYDSPQSATMYDPQPQGRYAQQTPAAAYPPTPSQQTYYLYPTSTGPPSGYENGHSHAMPMGMLPAPAPMDSSGAGSGSIAPAMTTITHEHQQQQPSQQPHYLQHPQDRTHHSSYAHHPHPHMGEHTRPVAPHEYQPPPSSHGHVPPHVQGWPQQQQQQQPQQPDPGANPGPDMWGQYKFYGGMGG